MSNSLELKVLFTAIDKFVRPVKNITQGAKEASAALKANRDSLRELEKTAGQIDAFKKLERDIAITANAFKGAQSRVEALKSEIARVGAPTKAMSAAMSAATKEAEALKNKHQSLATAEQQLFRQLKASGVDTHNLADKRRELSHATAEAAAASKKLQSALEAENQKMKRLHAAQADLAKSRATAAKVSGAGRSMMAGGAAVSAAAAVPVAAYAIAEDAATQLNVAMMQKGGRVTDQFREINDLAGKLGNKLPGTTADFQNMMTMLVRQGMSAKSILGGLGEATAYLGVQLKMSPEAAAEFASKLQDATRTADKDMMGLMDTIQKTFYLGVDSGNMLQGFAKLSPALSILKKDGLEASRILAPLLVMTDQAGMAGEAAGNAYRKIFQQSMDAKKLAKGNAELKGTGVRLDFTDGKGEFGGLDKMYQQLEKLKGVNTQQRLAALKKMFGDDAETLQALTIMIEKGAAGYAQVQAKMTNQANIQERVNTQLGTLKNLWDAASGTFTNALVAFGESIAPELHATAEWLGKVAERTQAWAKANPGLAAALMTTVKYLGMFLLVGGGIVTMLAAVAGPLLMAKFAITALGVSGFSVAGLLSRAFGMIGTAVMTLGRALLMNPIGLAITAIAVAAFLIYRYWEPIKAFFSGLWDQVKQVFGGGLTGILALIANWSPIGLFYKAMASVLGYFGIELPGKFTEFGGNLMAGLVAGITNGIQAAKAAIGGAGDAVIGFFKEKLGIHSPSKVFAELGQFTMAGLEQGLLGGESGPLGAVSSMAKKLAGIGAGVAIGGSAMAGDIPLDARPPVSAAQSIGSRCGDTYHITIQAAPGADAQSLAAEVERVLDRIESRKAAQRRSRLRDTE